MLAQTRHILVEGHPYLVASPNLTWVCLLGLTSLRSYMAIATRGYASPAPGPPGPGLARHNPSGASWGRVDF